MHDFQEQCQTVFHAILHLILFSSKQCIIKQFIIRFGFCDILEFYFIGSVGVIMTYKQTFEFHTEAMKLMYPTTHRSIPVSTILWKLVRSVAINILLSIIRKLFKLKSRDEIICRFARLHPRMELANILCE